VIDNDEAPVKFAVTVCAEFTVTVVVPEFGFATLPVQFTNRYPLAGVALICTTLPLPYEPFPGDTVPRPDGLAVIVR
jgi:hypothetical protein